MEYYINNNLNDITYMSELIQHQFLKKCLRQNKRFISLQPLTIKSSTSTKISAGFNSSKQLTFIPFRKLRAH